MARGARPSVVVLAVLLIGLVTAVAAAAAGELYVRHREATREDVPGSMPFLFYRHARLRHALVRDFDYFGWARINEHGFRGVPVPLDKPPERLRIMTVGASTTFDSQVSGDAATWPARLQHHLIELTGDPAIEVVNAGVPGYVVLDNLIRLTTELYRFRPDVIVLYHAHNDLNGALSRVGPAPRAGPRPDEVPAVTPWARWLEQRSLLYVKVLERWNYMRAVARGRRAVEASAPTREDWERALADGSHRFRDHVTSFVLLARYHGIDVVLPEVVQTAGPDPDTAPGAARETWARIVGARPVDIVLEGYRRYNRVLSDVADATGAVFVPTADFGLTGPAWYATGDPIHFNDAGADAMGLGLARALAPKLAALRAASNGRRAGDRVAADGRPGGPRRGPPAGVAVPITAEPVAHLQHRSAGARTGPPRGAP